MRVGDRYDPNDFIPSQFVFGATSAYVRDFCCIVPYTVLEDKRLSWEAKGIYCGIKSLGHDYEIDLSDLMIMSTGEHDSIVSGIKELIHYGYLLEGKEKPSNTTKPKKAPNDDAVRPMTRCVAWRNKILKRDNNTCVICGDDLYLNAHHLNGYHWYREGRFDIDNGVTLCKECHKQFHHEYGIGNNTREQYESFYTQYAHIGGADVNLPSEEEQG